MPETFIIPHARTMLGGRRPPSGLGIKGERREAKVFRMAKSGRDVKQRLFKIEKRNTGVCVCVRLCVYACVCVCVCVRVCSSV